MSPKYSQYWHCSWALVYCTEVQSCASAQFCTHVACQVLHAGPRRSELALLSNFEFSSLLGRAKNKQFCFCIIHFFFSFFFFSKECPSLPAYIQLLVKRTPLDTKKYYSNTREAISSTAAKIIQIPEQSLKQIYTSTNTRHHHFTVNRKYHLGNTN